ncbi:MAG: UDP-N-acetylmuramate--L-alanine ligase, partial [Anaerolineae bacterium]|nr:UDP-N-acetylmuramate--L-alanine ligase [Anaerolineae bacterium]
VYKRQDIMADLMRGQRVIGVAGTKGKTTTTAMIAHILLDCGRDPSYIVGGVMGSTGDNARVGAGGWFVVEADEYDNMFLGLRPDVAVITNIEWDHPDFFPTPQAMIESFRRFAALLPHDGLLLTGADTPPLSVHHVAHKRYGLTASEPDWCIHTLRYEDSQQVFDVTHRGVTLGTVRLGLPGAHNALNALAALAVAHHAGVPFAEAATALASFKPTARRFELRAEINDIAIIDDYAHNPMSIRAVLDAARQRYPGRAIWAIWQPHTYSRTQALFADFVTAFAAADHVLITDIYAAREQPMPGVNSAALVAAIQHADARHTATFDDAVAALRDGVRAPAVVLIMSAGDAPQIGIAYERLLRGAT